MRKEGKEGINIILIQHKFINRAGGHDSMQFFPSNFLPFFMYMPFLTVLASSHLYLRGALR